MNVVNITVHRYKCTNQGFRKYYSLFIFDDIILYYKLQIVYFYLEINIFIYFLLWRNKYNYSLSYGNNLFFVEWK